MEKPLLEKVIERLEKLDIREWTFRRDMQEVPYPLTAETGGLRFILRKYQGLEIENITGGPYSEYHPPSSVKNKHLKEKLNQLYDTICTRLKEYQKKELEEKLNNILLD